MIQALTSILLIAVSYLLFTENQELNRSKTKLECTHVSSPPELFMSRLGAFTVDFWASPKVPEIFHHFAFVKDYGYFETHHAIYYDGSLMVGNISSVPFNAYSMK